MTAKRIALCLIALTTAMGQEEALSVSGIAQGELVSVLVAGDGTSAAEIHVMKGGPRGA